MRFDASGCRLKSLVDVRHIEAVQPKQRHGLSWVLKTVHLTSYKKPWFLQIDQISVLWIPN